MTPVRLYGSDALRLYLTEPPTEIVQRLYLPVATRITGVTVELDGPPTTNCGSVVVYGHEGGLIAPRLNDGLELGTLTKKSHGIEKVTLTFNEPFVTTGGQMFLGIRHLDKTIRVLVVNDTATSSCTDLSGTRHVVLYRVSDESDWRQTPLPLACELNVDMPLSTEPLFVRDTTVDGASDRTRIRSYLSAGDLNGDGIVDIAAAGILYLSQDGEYVNLDLATGDTYPYGFFLDLDQDGQDDFVTLDLPCAREMEAWQWANGKLVHFASIPLDRCLTVQSMSIVQDGEYPTVLLSGIDEDHGALFMVELAADRRRVTPVVYLEAFTTAPLLLAADWNVDHQLEVLVRSTDADRVLRVSSDGSLVEVNSVEYSSHALQLSSPSLWVDADHAELLLPRAVPWFETESVILQGGRPFSQGGMRDVMSVDQFSYDERPSAVLLADLDNDGADEALWFGLGSCRALRVFVQEQGRWVDVTAEFGLSGVFGAEDGIIADLDADGRLDLVLDRNGIVEFWRNRGSVPTGTTINLRGLGPGATIIDPSTGSRRAISRGRGRLIESPAQIHFSGLAPDSLIVEQSGSRAQRMIIPVGVNHVASSYEGARVLPASEAEVMPRLSYVDGRLEITGLEPGVELTIRLMTMSGRVLLEETARVDRELVIEIDKVLVGANAASGMYLASVTGQGEMRQMMITYMH